MANEPNRWRNRAPGDTSLELEEVTRTELSAAFESAETVEARAWGELPLSERMVHLKTAQRAISLESEALAQGISRETGKPLKESRGEMGAVVAKIDLTIQDAQEHLADRTVREGPHPALVRRRPRGLAAVVGPFNFPIHLAHGASVAHLLAGNPVLFKPSPLAAAVAGRYAQIMSSSLPPGVFTLVQGGSETGAKLCADPRVRSVCFTGSVAAGRSLATALAGDLSKDLALELGGKNAAIVLADADLEFAAQCVAEGMCLTAGQRCNATSRLIVEQSVASRFVTLLLEALQSFRPSWPVNEDCRLGPLISAGSVERFDRLCATPGVDWILRGEIRETVDGRKGHYVTPAVGKLSPEASASSSPLLAEEAFAPLIIVQEFASLAEAIQLGNHSEFGLTTSIFTRSEELFWQLADRMNAGNVYSNLPTTFSPGTLPFGGWGNSGNRKPGGRGFIRFTTEEQAIQLGKDRFA